MHRYRYTIRVVGQTSQCHSVKDAAAFINTATGVPIVSPHMLLNYFTRPHLVNKKLFCSSDGHAEPVIQIHREAVAKGVTPASNL